MDVDILETTFEYNNLLLTQLKELENRNTTLLVDQQFKLLEIYKNRNQLLLNELNISIATCQQLYKNNQEMLKKIHVNINRKDDKN